ncbi:hypothetical protein AXG93_2515s1180 [Marchantia polymorpha subsp. ruderalis]|uniref:Uncharacterized protein n=1 Tax=Marchantia polymorpha subsp. ruderalis TaxID=1480154 RepID=A0A176W578_MARPO|nr:hypothetical protein AXG93_2515s1180 [Marchantia polymorpha subsp. ruderalis]
MGGLGSHVRALASNRWLVLAASILTQACSGVGYAFGSYSPIVKSTLGYNQNQISRLGVAKDIGDNVGILAGTLCDYLPTWGLFVCGAALNLVGYGWLWLIVTAQVPPPPFWVVCVIILMATNGETFFNTAALMSCVKSFPHHRGGTVGILKGFTGLSGAIFTQLYASFFYPDQAKFIFLVAVGPFMVGICLMFVVRPIPLTDTSSARADDMKFNFIYSVCLLIAAYLMGVIIVNDVFDVSQLASMWFAFVLLFLLALPLGVPLFQILVIHPKKKKRSIPSDAENAGGDPKAAPLLDESDEQAPEVFRSSSSMDLVEFSEMEDEAAKPDVSERVRRRRLQKASTELLKAVAEGAVKTKRRKGPRRGENFTVAQTLVKADFWLLFFTFVCGSGSGLTVIDNLGQMGESQGYADARVFVSLIGIWSFLGRIGAGWASEIVARKMVLPRPVILAASETVMAIGHLMFAMAWPGSMYIASLLVGFGHGTHWSVVPATASELFGLKNFGSLYNILTMALPTGTLVFSGLIAGPIYDREAAKQHADAPLVHTGESDELLQCRAAVCFRLTFFIMTGVCLVGVWLNLILIKRTTGVYQTLYGKQDESKPASPSPGPSNLAVVTEEA